MLQEVRDSLTQLYLSDSRPWLVGFSGGKDSTLVAALIFEIVLALQPEQRIKPIAILCTDTRVEIPAVVERIGATLDYMRATSERARLGIEVHLLRPPVEESFWVNIIGRGYPPPNRTFRWCTQRMKIDPVNVFVRNRVAQWGESLLHLGARRAESATRAQTMQSRESRNGLRRHPDLLRVWVSNPIEFLSTQDVWAYLLQKPNPWGGDNRSLYKLYANAGGGECPVQIDTSTPACGHSRFGCWTCTVVERDKASEGLLAAGDERMERLIEFRQTLLDFQNPDNGWRDKHRMNGNDGNGPLTIEARRELLRQLLALQADSGLAVIGEEELFEIQKFWKSARRPDDGRGVAEIVAHTCGTSLMHSDETDRLHKVETAIAAEKGIRADTLQRLLGKVAEYSEYERARGLHEDLSRILNDELRELENSSQS